MWMVNNDAAFATVSEEKGKDVSEKLKRRSESIVWIERDDGRTRGLSGVKKLAH